MENNRPTSRHENIIFGTRSVLEAINSGKELDKVLVKQGLNNELFGELREGLKIHEIPYQFVPLEKLNRVTRKNHQGVIAFVSEITYATLDQELMRCFEAGEVPLILVLDQISDVRNFGAIARSAEVAGAHAIVVPKRGAAQINADAMKTSAGALHYIPVCRENSLLQAVKYLKESGCQIIAATEKAVDLLYETDYTVPTVIIMGAEDEGISNELLKIADHLVQIPILGRIASLNVSVASSVMLFEAVRQRIAAGQA